MEVEDLKESLSVTSVEIHLHWENFSLS